MKRLAFFLILASSMAFGQTLMKQDTQDASNIAGANRQATARFDNIGSSNIALEFVFSGAPATTSIPIRGCMRGGTCSTIVTVSAGTNTVVFVNGLYDNLQLTPVFTGGTNPFVTINYTSITQSAGVAGGGAGGFTSSIGVASAGMPADGAGNTGVGQWGCSNTGSGLATTCGYMAVVEGTFGTTLIDRNYYCDKSVAISTAAAATTQLIALNGTNIVRVCGFTLNGAGATTVKIQYGTGALCATGTTDLTGAMTLAAGTNISVANGGISGEQFRTIAGQAVCLVNSAAVQVSGWMTYQQR